MSDLLTVLIAEKEHIDAIRQDNKLFFEPFLESKKLAFCCWNPEGQSLEDAVPGLTDAVGREKTWRAVIINHCVGDMIKERNPFDIIDGSRLKDFVKPKQQPEIDDESFEKTEANQKEWGDEWQKYYDALFPVKEEMYSNALKHPLQKLVTWLCYQPEGFILNDVQEKEDVHEWALKELEGKEKTIKKSSEILEFIEREHYRAEARTKEMLRKNFVGEHSLNIAYPLEVHCISLRTAESNFFDPDSFWNIRSDHEYSTFVERNMYFDKMRFMVFDILPKTHRDFRTDYIRFLASVLIFASNPVPIGAMQTRRLYKLETETDDTPLCTLVTSYDRKLAATSEVIDNEIEKIRSEIPSNLTDKEVEAILSTPKNVTVALDESCDTSKVRADDDYGFFYDDPENEFHKWNRSYEESKRELAYIVKQQSHSIRRSVSQAKFASEVLGIDVGRLNSFQMDDIREYTDSIENTMVNSIPADITDLSQYTDVLEEHSENVKKVVRRRMTKKTTTIIGAGALGMFLMCFLPFLLSNANTPKTVSTAVVLTGAVLLLLIILMAVTLFFLRLSVKKAVGAYNDAANGVISEINAALKAVSVYLSAFCSVKRGHAVQNYSHKNLDQYTKGIRVRQKHLEDIRKKRAYLAEEYRDYLGDRSYCDEVMSRPYDYDFDHRAEYPYPAPFLAGDSRQIEFLGGGNLVTVPSSYIKRISARLEGIYE